MVPGAPAADAPVHIGGRSVWLLDHLGGQFDLLVFAPVSASWLDDLRRSLLGEVRLTQVVARATGAEPADIRVIEDAEGLMRDRYDGQPGTVYLLRPDQHVAARWRTPRRVEVLEGVVRAQGRGGH
jgi:3-(3-hydroxy-phenyl)propionate hydroxylase